MAKSASLVYQSDIPIRTSLSYKSNPSSSLFKITSISKLSIMLKLRFSKSRDISDNTNLLPYFINPYIGTLNVHKTITENKSLYKNEKSDFIVSSNLN